MSGVTYYVDPDDVDCDDTNAGTDSNNPWCTPPGTRTVNNSGYLNASWGSITTSNKIACNDIIYLRGGSTHDSADGGAWAIHDGADEAGTGYYTLDCADGNDISILVATDAQWTGSSGHFTLDGTGITITCLGYCGAGGTGALLLLVDIDTVTLGGASATQRLIVRDGADTANEVAAGIQVEISKNCTPACETDRTRIQWVDTDNNETSGIVVGGAFDTPLSDGILIDWISRNNGGPCLNIGLYNDHAVEFWGFINGQCNSNGATEGSADGDAIRVLGAYDIWIVDVDSYDNNWACIDPGTVTDDMDDRDWIIKVRNFRCWDNALDATAPGQWRSSGCEGACVGNGTYDVIIYAVGVQVYGANTGGRGGFEYGHGGGSTYAWHVVNYLNDALFEYNRSADVVELKNSIGYGVDAWVNRLSGDTVDYVTDSDFNIYHFTTAQTDFYSGHIFNPGFTGGQNIDFQEANNGDTGFNGANDLISDAAEDFNPDFVNIGGTCATGTFENCDFNVQSGSPAIDAGTFFMLTTNSGTASTGPINVDTDPRFYFRQPSSYRDATGETIEIEGAGEFTIASMTSSSITLTSTATWSIGDGVHLPWNGSAPDIGYFEFEAAGEAESDNLFLGVEF